MASQILFNDAVSGNRVLIMRKLMQLRLAVLGLLLLALIYSYFQLDLSLNYSLLVSITLTGLAWSGWIHLTLRLEQQLSDAHLFRELLVDCAWLIAVVLLTGRSTNPFIYYFLVLIAISATIFNTRVCWWFSGSTVVFYSVLMYLDLKDHFNHMTGDYRLHLFGMWVNFFGSALVVSYFVSKLAIALRAYQQRLSEIREDNLKSEQLVGIGTLAASTVHALGTPLSTLMVLLGERLAGEKTSEAQADIHLMMNQIERCKATMKKLSLLAEQEDEGQEREPVEQLLEDLKEHYRIMSPDAQPEFRIDAVAASKPLGYSLLLRHALINLIDNALQSAREQVLIKVSASESVLFIEIEDDGVWPTDLPLNWGKPVQSSKPGGLGIGVFLANSTIEKMGGRVVLIGAEKGKQVRVELPLLLEAL